MEPLGPCSHRLQAAARSRPTRPTRPSRPSRRSLPLAAAVAAMAVCALAPAGCAAGPGHGGGRTTITPMTGAAAGEVDLKAVSAVLDRQAQAVLTHDAAMFGATIDPARKSYLSRESQVFGNLTALPLAAWRLTLDPVQPVPPRADGATLRVTLHYRLAGFDRGDVVSTRYLTLTRRGAAGWVVSGDGTGAGLHDDPEIWDAGAPLTVARGTYSLVIGDSRGDGTRARLQEIAGRLDQAVPIVSGVVGQDWSRRVVALAPADDQQVDGLAGGSPNMREIAALATVTRDPEGADHGQDRVIIAPGTFGKLSALGRHVVLTHELTHVATGGARDVHTPIWLIEGLADYVGYKDMKVPVREAARELQAEVAAGALPPALPDREVFAGGSSRLPQAYEEAWLACRMIAERYGEPALIRLYRAAGRQSQDAALHDVLGLRTGDLTAQWRDYLRANLR